MKLYTPWMISSGQAKFATLGCSNFPAWLLMKACWISDVQNLARFDSMQPHYNLVHRAEFERELQAVAREEGIGVIPYSPLAAGFLTGKYKRDGALPPSDRAARIQDRYMNDQGFGAVEKLAELGQNYNATVAQMAIGWILANPVVSSAIIGANSVAQLRDTCGGADVALSPEDKAALDELTAWQ